MRTRTKLPDPCLLATPSLGGILLITSSLAVSWQSPHCHMPARLRFGSTSRQHLVRGLHLGTGFPAASQFSGLDPTFVVSNALHQPRQGLPMCGSVMGLVRLNSAQICCFTSLWAFQPCRKASGILPTSLSSKMGPELPADARNR